MFKNQKITVQSAGEVRQIKQREENYRLQQQQSDLKNEIEELKALVQQLVEGK